MQRQRRFIQNEEAFQEYKDSQEIETWSIWDYIDYIRKYNIQDEETLRNRCKTENLQYPERYFLALKAIKSIKELEDFQRNCIELGKSNRNRPIPKDAFDKSPATAFWIAVGQITK